MSKSKNRDGKKWEMCALRVKSMLKAQFFPEHGCPFFTHSEVSQETNLTEWGWVKYSYYFLRQEGRGRKWVIRQEIWGNLISLTFDAEREFILCNQNDGSRPSKEWRTHVRIFTLQVSMHLRSRFHCVLVFLPSFTFPFLGIVNIVLLGFESLGKSMKEHSHPKWTFEIESQSS